VSPAGAAPVLPDPYPVVPLTGPLDATVRPPGSKSLTNRALLAAALAPGRHELTGVLFADDTEAMLDCVERLGAGIEVDRERDVVRVDGLGGHVGPGPLALDARRSGTTSRFVLPALALGPGPYRLDGDAQLLARPMGASLDVVRALGAEVVEHGEPGHLPVTVTSTGAGAGAGAGAELAGGAGADLTIEMAGDVSSQFASGLLLVAPCRPGATTLRFTTELVSVPYVEMTVAVVEAFGARVTRRDDRTYVVAGAQVGGYVAGGSYAVEPDASAASYLFAAAAIAGGRVRVEGLGTASLQGDVAFVDVLEEMGADVRRSTDAVEVRGTGTLRGVTVDMRHISDTAQTLAAVAVFADGPTQVAGIGNVRFKETDRIAAVVTELQRCGIAAEATADGFVVHPGEPRPAVVQTYEDHRMAMSFALLGLRAPGIAIADPGCVAKTFPDYFAVLDSLRSDT
jgi:3-phosphoshikimate 1-carboxyvinyltransferase